MEEYLITKIVPSLEDEEFIVQTDDLIDGINFVELDKTEYSKIFNYVEYNFIKETNVNIHENVSLTSFVSIDDFKFEFSVDENSVVTDISTVIEMSVEAKGTEILTGSYIYEIKLSEDNLKLPDPQREDVFMFLMMLIVGILVIGGFAVLVSKIFKRGG